MSGQIRHFHGLGLEGLGKGLRHTKLAAQSVQIVCVCRRQGLPQRDTATSCKPSRLGNGGVEPDRMLDDMLCLGKRRTHQCLAVSSDFV